MHSGQSSFEMREICVNGWRGWFIMAVLVMQGSRWKVCVPQIGHVVVILRHMFAVGWVWLGSIALGN